MKFKTKPPLRQGDFSYSLSGREDLNLRPLAPHASALAGLRHAPIEQGAIIAPFSHFANVSTLMSRLILDFYTCSLRTMQIC